MAVVWEVGDEILAVLENNFDGKRTPNKWTITKIIHDKNNYTIKNIQTEAIDNVTRQNLDFYFRLIRHTR